MKPVVLGGLALAGVLAAVFAYSSVDRGEHEPVPERQAVVGPIPAPDLAAPPAAPAGREPIASGDPESVPSPPAQPEPRLIDRLAELRSAFEEPVPVDGIEARMQEKYRDFEPADLLGVYPFVREAWRKGMYESLRAGIDSGRYVSEVLPAGEAVNTSKHAPPGETFHSIASETESLGNGLVEHRIVVFDRVRFPAQYARAYEEVWVHDRIDEAGICPGCQQPLAR